MARVIDLDAVVPEDIEFSYKGDTYTLPGDIDVERTFKLIRLFESASVAEQSGSIDEREKSNLAVKEELLAMFRERDPDLEDLPFGTIGYQHVLIAVLEQLGLTVEETPVDPPKPSREKKTPTQTVPRSRRSSGSPR